jgi:CTP synthase (UTP-ammonia lyase)
MVHNRQIRIALLGEHNLASETHIATDAAISHSAVALDVQIEAQWISSRVITPELLTNFDGLWVAPGPPHVDMERSLEAIRHAREHGIPTFGNCGGFQLIALEVARNLLGIHDAQHGEYSSSAPVKVVVPLSCSLRGQELPIQITEQSLVGGLYRRTHIVERYYCSFGINPLYRAHFFADLVSVTGVDDTGEIRVLEVPQHPFFLATLYVPQVQSSAMSPHPLVTGFIRSTLSGR